MIGIPMNPNSVYVPMVQSGCLKVEFDSTYPIHLNGIINQYEYQESIQRINRAISSYRSLLLIGILFLLMMIVGIILFIAGGVTAGRYYQYRFPVMIIIGITLVSFGSIFFAMGCCFVQLRRVNKIRQAISEESQKYSSRSPIPCSWRFDSSTTYVGYYGNAQRRHVTYHMVIDIGHSIAPTSVSYHSNQVAPDPTIVFGGQSNYAPPPYSGQPASYCPQCNVLRNDLTSRFCSSCGYSFNKY
ncbi:hypothetical protein I4U23_005985 [Adineta vaga]|nr:hypothetical protein I4U23_005985 [Adineta vaga]